MICNQLVPRKKKVDDQYFGQNEEDAVNRYLTSKDSKERNQIYNDSLRKPLNKMIESIIRKYGLYRKGETFEDLHADTLSFLITKADKFEPDRNKKAYSYYGTICKNYLLGHLIKDEKYLKQNASYEDIAHELEEREDLSYVIDEEEGFKLDTLIIKISDSIKKEISESTNNAKKIMTDGERKVGYALIEILDNWEINLLNMEGGSKYNKNSILEMIRNFTMLSTKDIRNSLKRYKELYFFLKQQGLKDEDC